MITSLTILILVKVSSATYPDCLDPTTYTNYSKSTEYKGLNDDTPWDRTRNTSDKCNLTIFDPSMPVTCGDCDFNVDEDKWFRFDQGPYVKIAEFTDTDECPVKGHCNGFYQIVLVPNDKDTGNTNSKYHYLHYSEQYSDPVVCTTSDADDAFMVESFNCDDFILYKFPSGLNDAAFYCNDDVSGPSPYSLCMYDTIQNLTVTANRIFYMENTNVPMTCTASQSPKPPNQMTWTDPKGSDITSEAKRDTILSSLFTAVYSLTPSTSYTSVTCEVDDLSHTFYQVSLQAQDVTGIAGKEVNVTCSATLDELSPEIEENFYFIEVLDDSDVYYTAKNISDRSDRIVIDKGSGTHRITLVLSNTSVADNVRSKTEKWKCGVRDPITEVYMTTDIFTVTFKSCDLGRGFLTDEATDCKVCPKNTFSSRNQCLDCADDQISGKGASQCFKIVAKNRTGFEGMELKTTCSIILDSVSEEIEKNLYLISVLDDEEKYYATTNITDGQMQIEKVGSGTYNISLIFSNSDTTLQENERRRTENWKCGVRDPITKIYSTVPFTVTIEKRCDPGDGFLTDEATDCMVCPKNTFSSQNQCLDCADDQISGKGASQCFKIVAKDRTGFEGMELKTTCSIILDSFSEEIEKNLYLISVLDEEELYYNTTNITDGQMQIEKLEGGTYNISLIFSNSDTSVAEDVRSRTENWKCGVRDPITKIYSTVPFTVTISRRCDPGEGFLNEKATTCTQCPENKYSTENQCEDCPKGEISQPGSDRCDKEPRTAAAYYAVAGVGAGLLIILALMIAALIWNKRRQETNNVVIANPSNIDNGRPTNKNSSV